MPMIALFVGTNYLTIYFIYAIEVTELSVFSQFISLHKEIVMQIKFIPCVRGNPTKDTYAPVSNGAFLVFFTKGDDDSVTVYHWNDYGQSRLYVSHEVVLTGLLGRKTYNKNQLFGGGYLDRTEGIWWDYEATFRYSKQHRQPKNLRLGAEILSAICEALPSDFFKEDN